MFGASDPLLSSPLLTTHRLRDPLMAPPFRPMSSANQQGSRTSAFNFRSILQNALNDYTKQTGVDLSKYDFAKLLEGCDSSDEVLWLLKDEAEKFKEYREGNRKLINWISPIVKVVHVFAGAVGEGAAVPFSPAKAVFVALDVLLVTASDVSSSYDALVELFECIGSFLKRLSVYTQMPIGDGMADILVRIMVEVLSVLALATNQIQQGRIKKFAKKLLGESDIEAVLRRLDRLTEEEARMTMAQTLEVVYGLVNNVRLVMNDGRASTDCMQRALVTMNVTVSEIHKMRRDHLQDKVRNWLCPPDPSTSHNIACEASQAGTAAWFFRGGVFAEWKATGSLLWIYGKPGSGKSTLVSSIIQDLDCRRVAGLASVAYYYFDFRDADKQHRQGLLSSLLVQLSAGSDPYYDILSGLYSTSATGTRRPTDGALTHCLEKMLERQGQATTYIIIDGIDECPNTSGFPTARERVLQLLEALVGLQLQNLRICVASRPEVDIRDALGPLASHQVCLHDESGQRRDIRDYITKVVRTDRTMSRWRAEDKELVIEILSKNSNGMFRWASCQLESLRRNFPASVRRALNALPRSLDETYEQILLSIDEEKREYALHLFQCLTMSIRPLRVDELAEVLAIRFNSDSPSSHVAGWRSRNAEEAVLSACSSLITVANVDGPGSRVVQFSHFSVKEFLTSERLASMGGNLSYYHILPGPAHIILAKACLSILLTLDNTIDKKAIQSSPLAFYAAQHWVEHAQFDDVSSHIQDAMVRLFDPDKPHFAAWIWLFDMDRHWGKHMSTWHPARPQACPLYYATLCGFYGLVEHLVRTHPSDINTKGGWHVTALHASLGRGHRKITPLLLRHGANVHVPDQDGATPLHRACRAGNLDLVRLLLEYDADVHAQTRGEELPLHFAASEGAAEICRLLLNKGACTNCQDNQGLAPLHSASRYGHLDVVRILLDHGVDVNIKKKDEWTALHLAAANGKYQVAHLLIQHGAVVDMRNNNEESPLDMAVDKGHLKVARLLLNSGAKVNVTDKLGWSPLHTAASNGRRDIVQLLLVSGARLDARNGTEETPLALACGKGNLEVSRFLIDRGSDMNSRDKEGWTPLHSASRHGRLEVARLLLGCGVDVNAPKADRWTSLHLASANGFLDIVKLLIKHNATVDSRNGKNETPLDRASGNGHLEIVRFLIERGAAVSSRDDKGWTPFHTASKCGHVPVAKFLLECGVVVDVRTGNEETALDLASSGGKLDMVWFLIQQGASINTRDSKGWSPLHTASQNGHLDVVRFLVDSGAVIDIRNGSQKTPLALASGKGGVEVSRYLIERGADMNARDNQSWAPLHFASRHGHADVVQLLLASGVDANLRKDDRWTALHLASANGHIKIVQLLVQHDAKVDVTNDKQETPLDRAAGNGKVEVARFLIDQGADVHTTDGNGWTPLHAASGNGHLEVVKLLLSRGADVDVLDKAGKTAAELASKREKTEVALFLEEYKEDPEVRNEIQATSSDTAQPRADEDMKVKKKASLHTAAEEGKVDVVRSLLYRGANVNAQNEYRKSPLDLASTKGHLEVVRLLVEKGAEVDSRDRFGWTPLHKASRFGHLEVSQFLIENGAEINAKKQDRWTPLHLAARNGHLGMVKLLLERGADVDAENDVGRTPYHLSLAKGYQAIADLLQEHAANGA